jgi:hypothetical protein
MSKKIDFNKSLIEMSVDDLKARIKEDEMRMKKLDFCACHHAARKSYEHPFASPRPRQDEI